MDRPTSAVEDPSLPDRQDPLDEPALRALLRRLGLATPGETLSVEALEGGVSSDIRRIDLPGRSLCVKRALPRLKVAADWRVPVERSGHEAEWLAVAGRIRPGCAPRLLGYDAPSGTLAMEWLEPARYPVWKPLLRDGHCDPAFAAAVADGLATLHAATAGDAAIAARFDTGALFRALRLDPYLVATAARHPALAHRLHALADTTAATRLALVHGDVSPKNILVGPAGPVLLDAECAWYGDPAFDAAFCLNHLLLKCLWNPAARDALLDCFEAFAGRYLDACRWEAPPVLAARVAALLPALMLARVDGKSPVEYLVREEDLGRVRRFAAPLVLSPPDSPLRVADAWRDALAR
jgi:aminoglycoside phosphotransferase (APT) family kinase protein